MKNKRIQLIEAYISKNIKEYKKTRSINTDSHLYETITGIIDESRSILELINKVGAMSPSQVKNKLKEINSNL